MSSPDTPYPGGQPIQRDAASAFAPSWVDDDDAALGCECALPVLQIDRWADEAPAQPQRGFY